MLPWSFFAELRLGRVENNLLIWPIISPKLNNTFAQQQAFFSWNDSLKVGAGGSAISSFVCDWLITPVHSWADIHKATVFLFVESTRHQHLRHMPNRPLDFVAMMTSDPTAKGVNNVFLQ